MFPLLFIRTQEVGVMDPFSSSDVCTVRATRP
jgi:hypothetical protein